jgi:hypothetical protein
MVKYSKSIRECIEKQVIKNRTTKEIRNLLNELTDHDIPSLDVGRNLKPTIIEN